MGNAAGTKAYMEDMTVSPGASTRPSPGVVGTGDRARVSAVAVLTAPTRWWPVAPVAPIVTVFPVHMMAHGLPMPTG